MNPFFVATKLFTPLPPARFVLRQRLIAKLSDGLRQKLILVSAPPGFGKTSLVAAWISSFDLQVVVQSGINSSFTWYSLDETDDDPAQFFSCLADAFQKVDPSIGQSIRPLLASPEPIRPEVLMASLTNDLASMQKSVILILDDYHWIHREEIHRSIQFLIERQPSNLHLVLLSREDPPLPLPRLRVRGEITEIREMDLRFTGEEASDFLNQAMGLDLSPESILGLENRTEGWIAGLQMAALALQALPLANHQINIESFITAFGGDDRFIMDYLMEEVFSRQSPEIQRFLLQTSILDRFCADLCANVFGDGPENFSLTCQQTLETLERANLFIIPQDNRREWYRYHRLFGDLLKYRLQKEYPNLLPLLHRRASQWFAKADDAEAAIKHALAIPDLALAADIADENALSMIGKSRISAFLKWVHNIPLEEISQRVRLCVGCGWASILTGRREMAEQYVAAGEIALENYEPIFGRQEGRWITREELHGQLTAIRAYIERMKGNLAEALSYTQRAFQELPTEALTVRSVVALTQGLIQLTRHELEEANRAFSTALDLALKSEENMYVVLSALTLIGEIAAGRGKLTEAADAYRRAIQLGRTGSGSTIPLPAVGYAHGALMAVHYQRNELAEAEDQLHKALSLVELIGSKDTLGEAYVYQALLAIERGHFELAADSLNQVQKFDQDHLLGGAVRFDWMAAKIHLWLTLGDVESASSWLKAQGILPEQPKSLLDWVNEASCCSPADLAKFLLLARLWVAQGIFEPAAQLVAKICRQAQADQNQVVFLETAVYEALLNRKQSEALAWLEKALNLAAPEGVARPFLNAGEPLIGLLRQALISGFQPAFTQKLLADLVDQERRLATARLGSTGRTKILDSTSALVEPLTGREQQILRLLAAGLSSREAADELVISVSTVRSYIKTLYQKLDAHNREEAIEKSRQLGLL